MEGLPDTPNILIGSYTNNEEKQSLYLLDSKKHNATSVLSAVNPSYGITHNNHVYIVEEKKDGLILTLNEKFELISRVSTMGDDPCHVSVDRTGNYLCITNYSSGSVFVCELKDHKPEKGIAFITLEGNSNHPQRQASSHPHCSVFSHDNKILFISDLGTDIVMYYTFSKTGVIFEKEKSIKMPDTGPRTLAIGSAESKMLYLSCELDNTIRVLSYATGKLDLLSAYKISNNPENYLSEISLWNDAVLVGLRGDNKIMIFDHDKEHEEKLVQRCSFAVGAWPRHFIVTAEGYLLITCQKDNKVQKFYIKGDKIYQISELEITTPSVAIILN